MVSDPEAGVMGPQFPSQKRVGVGGSGNLRYFSLLITMKTVQSAALLKNRVCVIFLGTEVAMDLLNFVAAPANHLFKGTLLLARGNFYNPSIWEIDAERFL